MPAEHSSTADLSSARPARERTGPASRHPLTSVLDPLLLDVLACPAEHHTPLALGEPGRPNALSLNCPECGRIYDVRDGIPVLLLEEARFPGDPAAESGTGVEAES